MGKENSLIDFIKNGDSNAAIKLLIKNRKTRSLSIDSKLLGTSSSKKLNINYQDENGTSALHQSALTGTLEITRLLIENGSKVDLKDNKGMRALHYAVTTNKLDMVNQLIKCGSSCNEASFNGESPLHLACHHGHADIVCQLLHLGANPTLTNNRYLWPLDIACEQGRSKIVEILLEKSPTCLRLLHDTTKDLIDAHQSTTCLHLAARNEHTDIIRLLLRHGIDLNRFSCQGTALHEASRNGRLQSAKVLLECGIDSTHLDASEQTAGDVAIRQKVGNDIRRLIKEFTESVLAVATHTYTDTRAGSLHFLAGDYLTVLERNPSGHWRGFLLQSDFHARFGYFPSTYVRLVDINHRRTASNGSSASTVASASHMVALNALKAQKCGAHFGEIVCDISPVESVDSVSKGDSGVASGHSAATTHSASPASHVSALEYRAAPSCMSFSQSGGAMRAIDGQCSVNVAEMMRSGLSDSQIILNWLREVNLESFYENFVRAGYDLLTIMKMTPSDLCALGIAEPSHRKVLVRHMKRLDVSELDERLNAMVRRAGSIEALFEVVHLAQYAALFRQQGFRTIGELMLLSWDDLEEIGVAKLGHQKKLMHVIKRLEAGSKGCGELKSPLQIAPSAGSDFFGTLRSAGKQRVCSSAKSLENLSVAAALIPPVPPRRGDSSLLQKSSQENLVGHGLSAVSQSQFGSGIAQSFATLPRKKLSQSPTKIAQLARANDEMAASRVSVPIGNSSPISPENYYRSESKPISYANFSLVDERLRNNASSSVSLFEKQQQFQQQQQRFRPSFNSVGNTPTKNCLNNAIRSECEAK